MAVNVKKEGNYELFETTKGNEILKLGNDWFALAQGQKGDIIVGSDSDHEKKRTLQEGKFKLVDFNNDSKFKDMPHLFLQKGGKYTEMILPKGLPSKKGDTELIVRTDDTIKRKELDDYLESPEPGPGEERMGRPGGGAASNVAHHLRGMDFPARKKDLVDHARKKKAPKAVMSQLDKLKDKKYNTMADVTKALGEAIEKERPPIDDYDNKNVREILEAMNDLDEEGIEKVKNYEQDLYGRKTILRKADQMLESKEAPVDNYYDLTARELKEMLDKLDEARLQELKQYEHEHKDRKSVIEAIDRELRH